jgi:hypothetical protein
MPIVIDRDDGQRALVTTPEGELIVSRDAVERLGDD